MTEGDERLDDAAETFFRRMPATVRYPQALVESFPRIANQIVELKDNKIKLRAYFERLTIDKRGERKGFSFDVLMDIQALREAIIGDATGYVFDNETKWIS